MEGTKTKTNDAWQIARGLPERPLEAREVNRVDENHLWRLGTWQALLQSIIHEGQMVICCAQGNSQKIVNTWSNGCLKVAMQLSALLWMYGYRS